jgi:hypothetical protein
VGHALRACMPARSAGPTWEIALNGTRYNP